MYNYKSYSKQNLDKPVTKQLKVEIAAILCKGLSQWIFCGAIDILTAD